MSNSDNKKPLRAKLIFNPTAGKADNSPQQLMDILTHMRDHNIWPEVNILEPGKSFKPLIKRAFEDGTRLIVASGGDGTIDSVAAELAGTKLTLGILPTGTANNLAINLRIPRNLDEAVALLREGRQVKIDLGLATSGKTKRYFLELVTLGLLSDIFPPADDFRRGEILKAGEVISTFAASSPSLITLDMDHKKPASLSAYSVVVANMPYIGRNFRMDRKVSFKDSKLDVFVFTELSKVGLLNYAIGYLSGEISDETVKHFRVRSISIRTRPQMAVNADGRPLPAKSIKIKVKPAALRVMAGTDEGHGPRKAEVAELTKVDNG
ncbi:MAG TPA: diacylglycerol kinase family protein, partial [Anaerolineales bacterium]|jgi:diacylglycerol kinase family enzyme